MTEPVGAADRRLWQMEAALRRFLVAHARVGSVACDCDRCHMARYLLGDRIDRDVQRAVVEAAAAETVAWERRTEREMDALGLQLADLEASAGAQDRGDVAQRLAARSGLVRDRLGAVGQALQTYRVAMRESGRGTIKPPALAIPAPPRETKATRVVGAYVAEVGPEVRVRGLVQHAVAAGHWPTEKAAEMRVYEVLSDKTRFERVSKGVYRCLTA